MQGFTFAVSDIVKTDADRYTFTLRLYCPPDGEAVTLRDCRLVKFGPRKAHVASPMTWLDGERVRVLTLPKRLRNAVIDEVLAQLDAGSVE